VRVRVRVLVRVRVRVCVCVCVLARLVSDLTVLPALLSSVLCRAELSCV
jgi:hypothetical protein